jgi:glycosyltransferase involved in cell wall biosynthesis
MPVLNSARFLRETLHSLIEQTYNPIELVVVDGGSTDGTLELLESYRDKAEDDLVIVQSEPGRGMGYDLNLGVARARGDFIARMDSDDVALPHRIADQVRFLVAHPDIDLAGTGVELFWATGGIQISPRWQQEILDTYLVNNPFFHPTVMLRRDLADRGIFRYDETFQADEDYELWGRLIGQATLANIPEPLLKYRIHEQNGQRMPWRYHHKHIALTRFCDAHGIDNKELIDELAEFQCSAFVTPRAYEVMKSYAEAVAGTLRPKLGWIQWSLVKSRSYAEFISWYWGAKGWRA